MKMKNNMYTQLLVCLVSKDSFLSNLDPNVLSFESEVRLDDAHLRQDF